MHAAWSDAITSDPLPGTRRAREIVLRILSDAKGADGCISAIDHDWNPHVDIENIV